MWWNGIVIGSSGSVSFEQRSGGEAESWVAVWGTVLVIHVGLLGGRKRITQRNEMFIIAFPMTIREMVLAQRPFWSPANHAVPVSADTAKGTGQPRRDILSDFLQR